MTLNDGSGNASAGAPQVPNLLSGYAIRPSWAVAGVDYAVGVPTGTNLKDPTSISTPGVTVDNSSHLVRVNGNNITLDGYNFTGWQVYITGGAQNVTVTNSYFSGGSGVYADSSTSNISVLHSTLDGSGAGSATSSLITLNGTGNHTVQYSWLENAPQHFLELNGSGSVDYSYNLIENGGTASGQHLNVVQFGGTNYTDPVISYNTIYQTREASGGELVQIDGAFSSGNVLTNALVSNNTMIALPGGGSPSVSYMIHTDYPTTTGTVQNNYMADAGGGAYGFFYPISGADAGKVAFSNNIDMATGGTIQANNSETVTSTPPVSTVPSPQAPPPVNGIAAPPANSVQSTGESIAEPAPVSSTDTSSAQPSRPALNGVVTSAMSGSERSPGSQTGSSTSPASASGADNVNTESSITFQWERSGTGNGTGATVDVGGAIHQNDLLLAFVVPQNTDTSVDPGAVHAPKGWSQLDNTLIHLDNTFSDRTAIFYRIANAGDPGAYQFNWTTSSNYSWTIVDYSGVSATAPIDASGGATNTYGWARDTIAPSISTTAPNEKLLNLWIGKGGSGPYDSDPSSTVRVNTSSPSSTLPELMIADGDLSAAGPSGSKLMTAMYDTVNQRGFSLALRPAGTGSVADLKTELPAQGQSSKVIQSTAWTKNFSQHHAQTLALFNQYIAAEWQQQSSFETANRIPGIATNSAAELLAANRHADFHRH